MVEFDAITVGAGTVAGGATHFQCVTADGVIEPITIDAGVECGHTSFFPGATVKEGARCGEICRLTVDLCGTARGWQHRYAPDQCHPTASILWGVPSFWCRQ